jgi:hypothetical protein
MFAFIINFIPLLANRHLPGRDSNSARIAQFPRDMIQPRAWLIAPFFSQVLSMQTGTPNNTADGSEDHARPYA